MAATFRQLASGRSTSLTRPSARPGHQARPAAASRATSGYGKSYLRWHLPAEGHHCQNYCSQHASVGPARWRTSTLDGHGPGPRGSLQSPFFTCPSTALALGLRSRGRLASGCDQLSVYGRPRRHSRRETGAPLNGGFKTGLTLSIAFSGNMYQILITHDVTLDCFNPGADRSKCPPFGPTLRKVVWRDGPFRQPALHLSR